MISVSINSVTAASSELEFTVEADTYVIGNPGLYTAAAIGDNATIPLFAFIKVAPAPGSNY